MAKKMAARNVPRDHPYDRSSCYCALQVDAIIRTDVTWMC